VLGEAESLRCSEMLDEIAQENAALRRENTAMKLERKEDKCMISFLKTSLAQYNHYVDDD